VLLEAPLTFEVVLEFPLLLVLEFVFEILHVPEGLKLGPDTLMGEADDPEIVPLGLMDDDGRWTWSSIV